jgi:hypothetical protein
MVGASTSKPASARSFFFVAPDVLDQRPLPTNARLDEPVCPCRRQRLLHEVSCLKIVPSETLTSFVVHPAPADVWAAPMGPVRRCARARSWASEAGPAGMRHHFANTATNPLVFASESSEVVPNVSVPLYVPATTLPPPVGVAAAEMVWVPVNGIE